MKQKCTILLLVRTASKRLSKKALRKIEGIPMILRQLDYISKKNNNNRIIICTTKLKSDDKLVTLLKINNFEVFRGSNEDILDRLYSASKKYRLNEVVVVEGDDIFCDPNLIKKTCKKILESDYDFISWKNYPIGISPVGLKTKNLKKLVQIKSVKNTETGWKEMIIESGLFHSKYFVTKNKFLTRTDIRLTIDYIDDFKIAEKIYHQLAKNLSLKNIIELFNKNPDWIKSSKQIQKKYERNYQKKKAKNIIRRSLKK